MSSKGTNIHTKHLPAETEHTLRLSDTPGSQHLKTREMRERQRFFEEVFQHDVEVYLSSAHLQIDYKRPPMGSISSMEVNVDMLEQMELLDITDPDALDVFVGSGVEDDALLSSLPVLGCTSDCDDAPGEICLVVPDGSELKSRMSSTSSNSTSDSQPMNEDGAETPVNQSDDDNDDDDDDDGLLISGTTTAKDVGENQSASPL